MLTQLHVCTNCTQLLMSSKCVIARTLSWCPFVSDFIQSLSSVHVIIISLSSLLIFNYNAMLVILNFWIYRSELRTDNLWRSCWNLDFFLRLYTRDSIDCTCSYLVCDVLYNCLLLQNPAPFSFSKIFFFLIVWIVFWKLYLIKISEVHLPTFARSLISFSLQCFFFFFYKIFCFQIVFRAKNSEFSKNIYELIHFTDKCLFNHTVLIAEYESLQLSFFRFFCLYMFFWTFEYFFRIIFFKPFFAFYKKKNFCCLDCMYLLLRTYLTSSVKISGFWR